MIQLEIPLVALIKLLTENPDQKQKLIDNPDLMPNFLQECIRMVSPVMHMRRTTTCETEVGGQRMGPGEKNCYVVWSCKQRSRNFSKPRSI